jgi:His/Glu/Gln/Arg/opine family amino acid ABC transporter permease subunit
MAIARLSKNWLIAKIAAAYVEAMRNTPLLLQLFVWYELVTSTLPGPRQAVGLFRVAFLSNRGLKLPKPIWDDHMAAVIGALGPAIVASLLAARWARLRQERTGRYFPAAAAASALVIGLPLAVILALGRLSKLPVIRAWCIVYIEIWRGVPLLSVLFMASVMFPLFLPEGVSIDKLLRVQVGIILFTAAYLAENVRGGLQALPKGQYEAADALGFGYWHQMHLVILPQALRLVIPPMVGQFITTLKDTSFVVVIGLYDLLSSTKAALADPQWRAFYIEGYAVRQSKGRTDPSAPKPDHPALTGRRRLRPKPGVGAGVSPLPVPPRQSRLALVRPRRPSGGAGHPRRED